MSFRNPAQRASYFEALRKNGQFNPTTRIGLHPTQASAPNAIAASPMLPNAMAVPMVNKPMAPVSGPNPMVPMNPAGANKFGRLKRFF